MLKVGENLPRIGLEFLEAVSSELKVVFGIDSLDQQLIAAFGFVKPFSLGDAYEDIVVIRDLIDGIIIIIIIIAILGPVGFSEIMSHGWRDAILYREGQPIGIDLIKFSVLPALVDDRAFPERVAAIVNSHPAMGTFSI